MSVEDLLKDEIESQLGSLEDMPFGSEEYSRGVSDTAKLLDKRIELERLELERQEKQANRTMENDLKVKQMNEERKDRTIKNGLTLFMFLTSLGVTLWANVDSKRFEQGYTHTTEAGRGSTRKLLNLLDKFK